jgi:uncharacterized membrane protein
VPTSIPDSFQDRLDSLEKTVANLARDLRALRTVVERLDQQREAAPAHPVQPESALTRVVPEPEHPRPEPPTGTERLVPAERSIGTERLRSIERHSLDLESLIGRYGTLALASLTILLGAGAFLSWAIAHGKIGPGLRVFLGALGAAAVAVVGWRLRARGSVRFGSTLLALALALVHVDAWGAGPYLKLVSSPVALSVAAVASIALALLAWVNDEEALFSVGVGGALVAPFVTSSDSGNVVALLVYGYVVLASGLAALRHRTWRAAVTVATVGCWLYVAVTSASVNIDQATARNYPAVFAIAVAWTAIVATGGPWGARVSRSALVALFGTLVVQATDRTPATDLLILAALGTVTAYVTVYAALGGSSGERPPKQPIFTAALIPLALGSVAVVAAPDTVLARTVVALAWTVAAVAAAFLQPAVRSTHFMVGGIASGAALLFALEDRAVASCVALSAHAATLSVLVRRARARLLGVPIALGLAILTPWTFQLLVDRLPYRYTPFFTAPSLAALAMSAAWLIVSWNAYRAELAAGGPEAIQTRTTIRLAGSAVTFLWGNTELSHAYSADVATFLLVLFYAAVGVAAIFVGRARGIRLLRQVGLGLAIFAALKAIAEASSLVIGLRVGSYLLAGLFLLAVAYWYRETESGRPGLEESGMGSPESELPAND